MSRPRDAQRSKVYAAEAALSDGAKFEGVPAVQAFVDHLLAEAWTRRRFGNRKIEVRDGRGRSKAAGSSNGWITLPKWARNEITICHELAHALGPSSEEAHGADFARRMLELVGHVMGEAPQTLLRTCYAAKRVKVGPPLKLRDLQPLPAPKKLWRIEAHGQDGTLTTSVVIEAVTLTQALQVWLRHQQGLPPVSLTVKRARRPVTVL